MSLPPKALSNEFRHFSQIDFIEIKFTQLALLSVFRINSNMILFHSNNAYIFITIMNEGDWIKKHSSQKSALNTHHN